MDRILRTFVGLRMAAAAARDLDRIGAELARLDSDLRRPVPEDLHITVQFLGETGHDEIHRIGQALDRALTGIGPMPVSLVGLGAYPEPARARVVWAGVRSEPEDRLLALGAAVHDALGALGFPPERRRWQPHVTLGRLRRRPDPALVERLERDAKKDLGHATLTEAKLLLSDPKSRPYRYVDLTTTRLGAGG